MPFGKVTNTEGAKFGTLEDGIYLVRLTKLEDDFSELYQKDQMVWYWLLWDNDTKQPVLDEDGDQIELRSWTSCSLNKKATARKWMQVLLGRELAEQEDPEAIAQAAIGKGALAVVSSKARDDGSLRWKIDSITPVKRGKAAPQPEPEAAKEPVAAAAGGDNDLPW